MDFLWRESYHISFWSILSIFEAFFGQLVVLLALWQFPGTLICSRVLKYCSNTKSFTTLLGSSFKWNKVPKYTFLCLVARGHSRPIWNDNRVVCYSHLQMPCSSISPPSSCSISCCPVRPFPPPGGVAPPPGDRRLWSWGSLEPQISLKSLLLPAPKSSHTGTQISSREKQISDDAMIKWTHNVTLEWTHPPRNISFDPVLFPGFLFLPICY